jgi:putative DNA-invertase from lambdoid prophage Rac
MAITIEEARPSVQAAGFTRRLYGYTRVSTAEQTEGGSLGEQRRRIEGAAMVLGLEVERFFEDGGVSGAKALADRAEGRRLLEVLRPGDTMVVAKLDRFARNAADALAQAEAFKRAGVDLIIVDIGLDPVTCNGVSKLFFTILSAVAEFERDRLRERQAEGQAAKLAKGGHIGGTAPFGYEVCGVGREAMLVPVPEQQAAGMSLRATADAVECMHGFDVSPMLVRRIVA